MKKRGPILLVLIAVLLLLFTALPVHAGILTFNSPDNLPANISAQRNAWLAAIGITTPEYLVTFESGFTAGQNVSGVAGLFPGSLVITDTDAGQAIIRSGSGSINNSDPVGTYALTQNERPYLELDFSARPIDYVAFQDIDHTGTQVIVTFTDDTTENTSFETTLGRDDSAEFFGIFRNDKPRIKKVEFDSSGSQPWGIDNIEYGVKGVPQVPEPLTIILLGAGMAGLAVMRKRNE